ncbi:hypothetical protein [Streptomyces flaveus]|uniref:hypothetical protein n=1 Tax=Streptomyces flaveus TaxID=66370 RepID=UPI00166F6C33|nr:hypothetical protein [Streptomyces flaveus]
MFIAPPGTKVTRWPYNPEADEQGIDQPCGTNDHGRSYFCAEWASVGQDCFYEFTLRITSEDSRSGRVAVSSMNTGYAPDAPRLKDPERGNTVPVQIAENDGVSGWAVAAGILAIVGSVLLVVRYRRRKISPSGPAKTA